MKKLIFIIQIFSFYILSANAAQKAIVSSNEAIIYAEPNFSSSALETKHAGDEIIISHFQKDGWFKAKTNTGSYGWVSHKSVAIGQDMVEVKMSNLDLNGQKRPNKSRERPPWLFARPSIGGLFTSSITIGGDRFKFPYTMDFLLDLSIRLGYSTRAAFRSGYYKTGADGNRYYSVYRTGFPILAGGEFLMGKSMEWQTWFQFYGGVDISTITLENGGNSSPKSTSSRKKEALGIISLMFKNRLGSSTRLTLETGLYFTAVQSRGLENAAFLSVVEFPDSIRTHFLGPLAQIGLEFEL